MSTLPVQEVGGKPCSCAVLGHTSKNGTVSSGKLTTAGSLYALYNDHSPDLPMGQLERRRDHHHFYTLPWRSPENR